MLRPATPLAILLFAAFVLLLLSVISTPIVRAIPLASLQGTEYGVFGFCQSDSCSGISVGYSVGNSDDFSLPGNARASLSDILIVHPVAGFLTLICLILAVISHFHSAAHSSRYLLGLIILLVPTLLISLLAFLVDVLLFAPHLAWGSWIVLAATIVIVISGILTCAMRRTLVSRKARKKRIAENAEMSGENFYTRQNTAPVASPPPLSQQPTAPMVNGSPGANALPAFATFENKSPISDDDRTPLNANSRSGTAVSGSTTVRPSIDQDGVDRYGPGMGRGNMPPMRGRGGYMGLRNEDGSPMASSGTLGSGPGEYPRRRPSNETMNSMNARGRGRGGFPPRGYGRGGPYNMRGGPGGRGGMPMGPMAMGAGAGLMAGEMMGRGRGPPPGYNNGPYGPPPAGRQGPPPGPYNTAYGGAGPAPGAGPGPYPRRQSPGPPSAPGYGRQPSPGPPSAPGYGRRQSPGPPSAPGYGRQPSPGPPSAPGGYGGPYAARDGPVRADSPPPLPVHQQTQPYGPGSEVIGQAVEMNEHTGSPANPSTPVFPPPDQGLRDSDSEVQGLVGLQQNRGAVDQHTSHVSSSVYSSQPEYVPPRAAWANPTARTVTPPQNTASPVAGRRSPPEVQESSVPAPTQARLSNDNYYEDVDPRFAEPPAQPNIPTVLIPGGQKDEAFPSDAHPPQLQSTASYDSVQDGTASEASNFTSISERGVNPQWQAEHPGYGMGGIPNRGPPPSQQRDFLLANNPDFELPSGRGGRGPGRGGRGAMHMGGMI